MALIDIFDNFPELSVGGIVLRQMRDSDAMSVLAYLSDREVNQYIPEECIPQTPQQALDEVRYNNQLFLHKNSIFWGIALKKTDELIGSVGFNYWNRFHSRAEISYDLRKDLWNKGIMTRVIGAVIKYGFAAMQLNRIEATIAPNNEASAVILRKYGFQREGVLREQKLLHGVFTDAVVYSLLKSEYVST